MDKQIGNIGDLTMPTLEEQVVFHVNDTKQAEETNMPMYGKETEEQRKIRMAEEEKKQREAEQIKRRTIMNQTKTVLRTYYRKLDTDLRLADSRTRAEACAGSEPPVYPYTSRVVSKERLDREYKAELVARRDVLLKQLQEDSASPEETLRMRKELDALVHALEIKQVYSPETYHLHKYVSVYTSQKQEDARVYAAEIQASGYSKEALLAFLPREATKEQQEVDTNKQITYFRAISSDSEEEKYRLYRSITQQTLLFRFSEAAATESYMLLHYPKLKKAVEQSIFLPELLKRDAKYWKNLPEDTKKFIEFQARIAGRFDRLLYQLLLKHQVDSDDGTILAATTKDGRFSKEEDYLAAKREYETLLEEYPHYMKSILNP